MPEYLCRLGAPDGVVVERRRMAGSEQAARRELEGEGFHVFNVTRTRSGFGLPFVGGREKVPSQEFMMFNTQLKTLLHAGLPLAQSLELLKGQQTSPHFRSLLDKVHQQVTTGIALSDAFLSLGDVFPRLYGNSLRAGEGSGEIEGVLERYVEYQRMVETVRKKIIASLTYPAVLVVMSVGLIILLVAKVIPSFSGFYVSFDSELPLITRFVLGLSEFVQGNWFWLVLGIAAGWVAFRAWSRTRKGRLLTNRWLIGLPLVGKLAHRFALSQFSRSMAVLLSGGTPMVPALETATTSVNNAWVSKVLHGCVNEVKEGRPLSDAVDDTGLASEMALAMIRVGEGTGALAEMLNHTSDFFDEEIEFALGRIVTIFEPMILVFMGLVVGGLLLAVYYPLLSLVTKIG
ncbi:MAG: type II secretion system F family protein [Thermoanaerobaculales bacterium]|nr:type II secretion system F family protein [Thermoanaerobaculales bacterium]